MQGERTREYVLTLSRNLAHRCQRSQRYGRDDESVTGPMLTGMYPPMRFLATLLALLSVPAFAEPPASVAVAFDRHTLRPVLAEGLADRAAGRVVSADSPVRIASISKLVTTLAVMRLVDRGKLDLDRDVSDYLGYPLRHPVYPDTPITLRLLLSHRAGLLDGEDRYVITLGGTLRARLAEPEVWDGAHAPGSDWFHYANINFPVVASVIEAVTGDRFDRVMTREVFRPLGLDACMNWSGCSPRAISHAVVLYRADGNIARDDLKGAPPPCPVIAAADRSCDLSRYIPGWNGSLFSPQGGVRISMRDLAKLGQMLARGGKGFLSARAYAGMTRAHWRFTGANGLGENGAADGFFCAYGLGLQLIGKPIVGCHDDLFGDARPRLGHAGDAYGLRSGLWFDPETGRGIAFFTTAVPDDAAKGRSAFTAREEEVVHRAGIVR